MKVSLKVEGSHWPIFKPRPIEDRNSLYNVYRRISPVVAFHRDKIMRETRKQRLQILNGFHNNLFEPLQQKARCVTQILRGRSICEPYTYTYIIYISYSADGACNHYHQKIFVAACGHQIFQYSINTYR